MYSPTAPTAPTAPTPTTYSFVYFIIMSEKTRISQRINAVIEDLDRWQSIPANYESILEERLFLVCKPPDCLKREKTPRSKTEYNSHARQKRARDVYLEVLTKFPLTFLPFLLVVSPRSCSNWKTGEIERTLKSCIPLQLNRRHEDCFKNIAKSKNITESAIYQKIKHLLFPSCKFYPFYMNCNWYPA